MRVIVLWEPNSDGGYVEGVFSSKAKAIKWLKDDIEYYGKREKLTRQEIERQKQKALEVKEYEEFEVDPEQHG